MVLTITILTAFVMFIYIFLVGEEYGLPEELNLQSKCSLDLLILREDLSPSHTALSNPISCALFITVYYSLKCLLIINLIESHAH